jgi:hypothetical protein
VRACEIGLIMHTMRVGAPFFLRRYHRQRLALPDHRLVGARRDPLRPAELVQRLGLQGARRAGSVRGVLKDYYSDVAFTSGGDRGVMGRVLTRRPLHVLGWRMPMTPDSTWAAEALD